MAKQFQFDDFTEHINPNCAACEELLADAVDDVLSPADQTFFDLHLTGCTACVDRYAQAKRGAAWLSMLKVERPEPAANLVTRILAASPAETYALAAVAPVQVRSNILPFRPPVSRFTRMTRIAMEPRLAMTAAMAFFSIALTLNLTGVRLDQLHASDLKPTNLKHSYYKASAHTVRFYDNLRVVRVLESRVDDLRQSSDADRDPASGQPVTKPENKPDKQPEPHGSSRRQDPAPTHPQGDDTSANQPAHPVQFLSASRIYLTAPLVLKGGLA